MSISTREATIVVDDKLPAIRITREFDAPLEKVFRAHVDPKLVAQWLGPRGYEMRIDEYDCRTGGAYRYSHLHGDDEYRFHGSFHEVRENEYIVQTFAFDGAGDDLALERMWLEDLGDGRTRLTAVSLGTSFESRDAIIASGMEHGLQQSYQRLDELLED